MGFWVSKKVLVTGGEGFLGSYIVKRLKDLGCGNIFIPSIDKYDLVNIEAVKRAYRDARPDIVIHLAAQVGSIEWNKVAPGEFFYNNIMMGVQLMEEARKNRVGKFVNLGTISSYPKLTPVPFKEEDLWNGYPEEIAAAYSMAKKILAVQGDAYKRQYGLNSIFLMPVNLYGPGDKFDARKSHVVAALIKKCFDAIKTGKDHIVAWGSGNPTREFLYVEDCAEAIILATEKYDKPDPVNIGSGSEISIKDLAELIAELTGFKGKVAWDASMPDGQPRRCVDTSKAKKEFGFVARNDLREGLKKTIEWYSENICQNK